MRRVRKLPSLRQHELHQMDFVVVAKKGYDLDNRALSEALEN